MDLICNEGFCVVTIYLQMRCLNSQDGETALFVAVRADSPDMVKALLEGGADPSAVNKVCA